MINSLQNETIKKINSLKQKKYREKYNAYLVYNEHIIEEAEKKGLLLKRISIQEKKDCLHVSQEVMKKLNIYNQENDIAIIKKKVINILNEKKILMLDQINDPGNLGTILRNALAFGFKDIFIGKNTVDLYNDKVISACKGANFNLNIMFGDCEDYLKKTNKKIITTFLDEISDYEICDEYILVLGNEAHGIDKSYKKYKDYNIKIPIKYESLNVGVASGIIMYELTKGDL